MFIKTMCIDPTTGIVEEFVSNDPHPVNPIDNAVKHLANLSKHDLEIMQDGDKIAVYLGKVPGTDKVVLVIVVK